MILALFDHDRGTPDEVSLETLAFGRRLSERTGQPLHALAIGASARATLPALAAHGAAAVHLAEDERLEAYAPEAWAACLVDVVEAARPGVVVAPGTDRGHEVMAHAAARLDAPMAANCTDADPGDPFVVTRQRWGGTLLEEAELDGPVRLLTVAPHTVAAEPVGAPGDPEVLPLDPDLGDELLRVRVVDRVEPDRGGVSLAEAKVVVGGGRGVGGPDGFRMLEELAELLGGAVGCSRVVTSAGWRPHTDQIGQTGTRIAPDLYIACGISGATQHLVGCRGAKRLLVINRDPEAPIVSQADYAIVGDLHEIVPALVAALRETVGG